MQDTGPVQGTSVRGGDRGKQLLQGLARPLVEVARLEQRSVEPSPEFRGDERSSPLSIYQRNLRPLTFLHRQECVVVPKVPDKYECNQQRMRPVERRKSQGDVANEQGRCKLWYPYIKASTMSTTRLIIGQITYIQLSTVHSHLSTDERGFEFINSITCSERPILARVLCESGYYKLALYFLDSANMGTLAARNSLKQCKEGIEIEKGLQRDTEVRVELHPFAWGLENLQMKIFCFKYVTWHWLAVTYKGVGWTGLGGNPCRPPSIEWTFGQS
jgi:hypothetical protein